MTVNTLRKQASHLIKTNKDGTYKERKRRAFILNKMIDGLYALHKVPLCWQDLESFHIHLLVKR